MVVGIAWIHHESKIIAGSQSLFLISPDFLDLSPYLVSFHGSTVVPHGNHDQTGITKAILTKDKFHSFGGIRLTFFEKEIDFRPFPYDFLLSKAFSHH